MTDWMDQAACKGTDQCSIPGCVKPRRYRNGMCNMHYHRVKRYGNPHIVQRPANTPHTHLPAQPLKERVDRLLAPVEERWGIGGDRWADERAAGIRQLLGDGLRRGYHKGVADGFFTVKMADRLAVAFGFHPAEIWLDEWVDLPDGAAV